MSDTSLPRVETLATVQRGEVWRSDTARALDHPVLFWITRGQGRFMVDCKMRGIGPNTAVFIPAQTLFSYELMAQPQGMVISLPQGDRAGYPTEPALLRAAAVQAQAELGGLIEALARELKEPQVGQNRAIEAHLIMISVWLDRLLAQQPQGQLGKSDRVLRKFSHVACAEALEPKTLGDVAADLDITPTHLTRLTQGAVGKPAYRLLQERVINAAAEALAHTDQPVREIARKLGFTSPAYFTRAFQAQTGKNPTEFRNTHRLH